MNGTDVAMPSVLARAEAEGVTAPDRSRSWRRITLTAAFFITVMDAALLERKHGLFIGGFLASHRFGTLADSAAFLLSSLLINATLAALLSLPALLVARRLRLTSRAAVFLGFCSAVVPIVAADFVAYRIWTYLGDAFDLHVMYSLTGHRLSEVFAITAPLMTRPVFVFAVGMLFVAAMTVWLHRRARHTGTIDLPSRDVALRRCLFLLVSSLSLVTVMSVTSDSMGFGLRATPSGQLFTLALNRLSDIDGDGYGLMRNPKDIEPFNPSIHPYAVDIPGNGVDENGIGGDLPLNRVTSDALPHPQRGWTHRPPMILFVLESVRADVIGARHNGRRVTPVLDSLSAEGLNVQSAWSHAGSTGQSRYHILTGSLVDGRGNSTLLDDFRNQGYEVGYFSGQDDDFGGMALDFSRLDKFYNARQDLSRRYTASTSPGSLAVPLDTVSQNIEAYLASRRSDKPLFLYVNFHDTHYPYDHKGLRNLLDVERLSVSLISPGQRAALWSTYLNTTANVDRAIGRVIQAVESHSGQSAAVVVTSDHGESLFEHGILGHGFALSEAQTRVPLIVRGLPMTVETPFGVTELRWALNDALSAGADARATSTRRSDARVFQYLGTLQEPSEIGWMRNDGWLTYDFRADRVGIWGSSVTRQDLKGDLAHDFQDLIYTWESLLLARLNTPATGR